MGKTLLLWLKDDSAALWGLFDDHAGVLLQWGEDGGLGRLPSAENVRPDHVWLIVPGTDVLGLDAELPDQSDHQLRRTLPFLLEDDVAVDAADLHFALGGALPQGRRRVAAVARARMDQWLQRLRAAGLAPAVAAPDYAALPAPPGGAVLLRRGGKAVVASAEGGGFSIEWDGLDQVLPAWLKQNGVERLCVHGPCEGLPHIPGVEVTAIDAPACPDLLVHAYSNWRDAPPLNLLQGAYAPRRPWAAAFSAWRRAAALAAVAAMLGLALQVSEGFRQNGEAERALARAEAVFRGAFPDVTRVVNPRAQMRAKVEELRVSSSLTFLQLAGLLADGVAAADGAEIDAMRFDGTRGELSASISLDAFEQIDQVKRKIAGRGGRVDEGTARQDGARIRADVVVRLP